MDMRLVFLQVTFLLAVCSGNPEWYRCPRWIPRNSFLKSYRDHCYEFIHSEKFWKSANNDCRSRGGHLVVIKDHATQVFIMTSLRSLHWRRNGVWIGANDREHEMHWKWVTNERITYNNWASGQPSCRWFCTEDCGQLRLDKGGSWHDYPCGGFSYHYSYICQYDMLPKTTTTTTTTTTPTTTTTTPSTTTSTTQKPTTTTPEPTTTTTTTTTSTSAPTTSTIKVVIIPIVPVHHNMSSANKESTSSAVPPTVMTSELIKVILEGHSKQKLNPAASRGLNTGAAVGLVLGILFGILIGICLGAFVFFRRRRKSVSEDLPKVSYQNPYYGDVTVPLASNEYDSDDGEKPDNLKCFDEGKPKNIYDIPPSMCMTNPTYGTKVMVSGTEIAYDVVKPRHVQDYDLPPPCGIAKRLELALQNQEPCEENLYESLENLHNLRSVQAEKDTTETGEKTEEERYVPMRSVPLKTNQA